MRRSIRLLSILAALFIPALMVHAVDTTTWGQVKSELSIEGAAKKAGKASICHYAADEGQFQLINVSGNAVEKHFSNHGDSFPGTFYADADGDGFGGTDAATVVCPSDGFVDNNLDTDDGDASINPDADEVCGDGVDNNSNGQIDEDCDTNACGPTDCTTAGTCLSDDFNSIDGLAANATPVIAAPGSFTTGAGACYSVPEGSSGPGDGTCTAGGNEIGWIGPGYIDTPNILWGGAGGLLSFYPCGADESKITTDLVTTPGATYAVSFDARRIEFAGVRIPRHEITVSAVDGGGAVVGTSGAVAHPTTATTITVTFVAGASGQTTLVMEGTYLGNNANQDMGFDNLVVSKL